NLVPGDTNAQPDVFVHDAAAGTTELISVGIGGAPANQACVCYGISADGNLVLFRSGATNLVPGKSTFDTDFFVRDRSLGQTSRVSVANDGSPANRSSDFGRLSADGNAVLFASEATNLVAGDTNQSTDLFVRDLLTQTTERVNVASDGTEANDGSDGFMA